ncbi:40016_t:CDS:2, partial [Gigaspora margarita]
EIEEVEDSFVLEEKEENTATNSVEKSYGHYEATCYYCLYKKFWARGKLAKLEITKAWIIAGIPFDIIENLFIIDMFKEIISAYNSPSR